MAVDLKPYFDAARAADDEVQRIMGEMNAAFTEGTEDGKAKALELRPKLDEAKKKAEAANQLYLSMRDAASTSDGVAKNFIPAAEGAAQEGKSPSKTRAEFFAMNAAERMKFVKNGGKVVDED